MSQAISLPGIFFPLTRCKEQNLYANIGPVVGKVMIVCPVSLINVSPPRTFVSHPADAYWYAELEKRILQMVRPASSLYPPHDIHFVGWGEIVLVFSSVTKIST